MALEVGFEISKAQVVSLFLLSADQGVELSATFIASCLSAYYALHPDDNGLTSETIS